MKIRFTFLILIGLTPAFAAWAAGHYAPGKLLAILEDPAIDESSGLAASRLNPGIFWTHNDSGDGPVLYAINRKGQTVAILKVKGANAVDWEDMAAGPGADGRPALYIGDIGDNGLRRNNTCVYRIPEPALEPGDTPKRLESAAAERFPFRYPDGHHDAEALMVHPETGRIYIITKEKSGVSGVYRMPLPLVVNTRLTLKKIASLELPESPGFLGMIPGADIAPDGLRCVVRTYLAAYEFRLPPGKPFEAIFDTRPALLQLPQETQGEAIAYRADGKAILTTSEKRPTPLHEIVWIEGK